MKNALTIWACFYSLEGCRKLAGGDTPGYAALQAFRPGRGDGNSATRYDSNQFQTDSGRKMVVCVHLWPLYRDLFPARSVKSSQGQSRPIKAGKAVFGKNIFSSPLLFAGAFSSLLKPSTTF